MAWHALIRTWNAERKTYVSLTLRIEDTQEPGCLLRLYEGETVVAEALADIPQLAMAKALQLARAYLKDASITEESLRWVQSS
jgi:hypothetical protein